MLEAVWMRSGGAPPELSVLMPIYRQPEFVADAVRSVLAQTGCVAEILISDDSSDDDTLDVALAVAQTHVGPHTIRVLRSNKRLALDHLGALVATSSLPFMVEAHGDDVSMPHRMATLLELHRRTGAALVLSSTTILNDDRTEPETAEIDLFDGWIPPAIVIGRNHGGLFSGARYGFHRSIYEAFSPLTADYLPRGHDALQPFRALLKGGAWFAAEPLLLRRQHEGQWSRRLWDRRRRPTRDFGYALNKLGVLTAMGRDLDDASIAGATAQQVEDLRALIDHERTAMVELLLATSKTLQREDLEPLWQPADQLTGARKAAQPAVASPPPAPQRDVGNRFRRLLSQFGRRI